MGLCGGERGLVLAIPPNSFPPDPLLQLQSLLCIIIFDVRSKGIANRRFTKVYEETFVLLEILYRTSYSGDSGD